MKKIQSSIFILLVTSLSVFSQENDFQSWYSFSASKKIYKKTDFTLKSGLRMRENSSLYSKNFYDFKIGRTFNKRFSFLSGYRYAINWDEKENVSNSHRFYADILYKNKLTKRLSYRIRNRWQNQGDIHSYKTTLRQKFSLSYNIRKTKITPKCATEYFATIDDGIHKLRSTFSVSYPIIKNLDFDLAYRMQNEFQANNPETLFIFEGKISYDL